ncbi:MAG: Asp-tRNA(Asn)/Glu-tRNA(Gln) amidotransferase subunit GatC [Planctomycetaceae bacterium]
MPDLSPDEVRKVAGLARLELSEDEVASFSQQLGKILDYVNQLSDVPTDGVQPMAHAIEVMDVFREDIPQPSLSREAALANAPKQDGRYFVVPAILDGA